MNRTHGWCCVIGSLLLWLAPTLVRADDAVFGPPEAQAVEFAPQRHIAPIELLPVEVNGRWGYADRRGDVVIEPRFEWTDYFYGPFNHGSRRVWVARYRADADSGLLVYEQRNERTLTIITASSVQVGRTSGVSPDRYSDAHAVVGRWVNRLQRYQIIAETEFGPVDVTYQGALRMMDGFAAVQDNDLCGFIDKRGKVVIPMQFAQARSFHDGFAAVRQPDARGGRWGFIDKSGSFRFQDSSGEIEELRSYHEGLAAVKARGKWGYFDKAQRVRIDPAYDEVRDFHDGRAAVRRGDAWGFIDITGKEIAFGFGGAWDFDTYTHTGLDGSSDNALASSLGMIRQGGGLGYIDRTGRVVLDPRYENALPFFRGVARVRCGGSFAYIAPNGKPVWDPRRVAMYGIRGLQLPEPIEAKWRGLPREDGRRSEPYPFEYDVPDLLTAGTPAQVQPDPQTPQTPQNPPSPENPGQNNRRGANR